MCSAANDRERRHNGSGAPATEADGLTTLIVLHRSRGAVGDHYVGRFMKTGRNDPCPCGSGQKHKKCCAAKDAEARSLAVAEAAAAAQATAGEAPPPLADLHTWVPLVQQQGRLRPSRRGRKKPF
jgi:hypothetical protein